MRKGGELLFKMCTRAKSCSNVGREGLVYKKKEEGKKKASGTAGKDKDITTKACTVHRNKSQSTSSARLCRRIHLGDHSRLKYDVVPKFNPYDIE